jgi:hypothetical protein
MRLAGKIGYLPGEARIGLILGDNGESGGDFRYLFNKARLRLLEVLSTSS